MTYASPSRAKAHLKSIETILDSAKGDEALFEAIVNAPFNDKATATLLGLGILVLLLVNNKTKTIDRIALSRTGPAEGAVEMSPKPFKAIKIPVNHADNIIAKAIKSGQYQATSDWQYLFVPDLTPPQARFNQAGAGIACSVVYPLKARAGGALIFSYYIYPDQISRSHQAFMHRYAEAVAARLGDLVPNHA